MLCGFFCYYSLYYLFIYLLYYIYGKMSMYFLWSLIRLENINDVKNKAIFLAHLFE